MLEWMEVVRKAYMKIFDGMDPDPSRVFNVDETPFNPVCSSGKVVTMRGVAPVRVTGTYTEFF